MNFIDTLKAVGGVKPCTCGSLVPVDEVAGACPVCHGTGQSIDLAPLLANTGTLAMTANDLLYEWRESVGYAWHHADQDRYHTEICVKGSEETTKMLIYVVGPQRSHSLVYEVARQLGGTAVVVEEFTEVQLISADAGCEPPEDNDVIVYNDTFAGDHCFRQLTKYRLSLTIPPDATVLFVTDILRKEDESWITAVLDSSLSCDGIPHYECVKYMDSVLCLISKVENFHIFCGPGGSKANIIALHREK